MIFDYSNVSPFAMIYVSIYYVLPKIGDRPISNQTWEYAMEHVPYVGYLPVFLFAIAARPWKQYCNQKQYENDKNIIDITIHHHCITINHHESPLTIHG